LCFVLDSTCDSAGLVEEVVVVVVVEVVVVEVVVVEVVVVEVVVVEVVVGGDTVVVTSRPQDTFGKSVTMTVKL